jgi:hypothetical protein
VRKAFQDEKRLLSCCPSSGLGSSPPYSVEPTQGAAPGSPGRVSKCPRISLQQAVMSSRRHSGDRAREVPSSLLEEKAGNVLPEGLAGVGLGLAHGTCSKSSCLYFSDFPPSEKSIGTGPLLHESRLSETSFWPFHILVLGLGAVSCILGASSNAKH